MPHNLLPPELKDAPQDLRNLTPEQLKSWVRYLAENYPLESSKSSDLSLRCRQSVLESQISHAHRQSQNTKDPHRREGLEVGLRNCQIMHDITSAAVCYQTFGEDSGWEGHVTIPAASV